MLAHGPPKRGHFSAILAGFLNNKTVLGELIEIDDDLAGDLALDGDKDNQPSGGGCSGDRQFDNCQQRN